MEQNFAEQELQQVIDHLRQYEEKNGTDPYSLCVRAQLFSAVGESSLAEKSLLDALKLDPCRIETLSLLAAFHSQKGDCARAAMYDGFTARELGRQGNPEQEKELDSQYRSFSFRQNALYQTAKKQKKHIVIFLSCEPFGAQGRQYRLACAFAEMGHDVSFIDPWETVQSAPKFHEQRAGQVIAGRKAIDGVMVYQPVRFPQCIDLGNKVFYEGIISSILNTADHGSAVFLVSATDYAELLKKRKDSVLIFDFGCQNPSAYAGGPWQDSALSCRLSMEQCGNVLTNSIPLYLQKEIFIPALQGGVHLVPDGKTLEEIQQNAVEKGMPLDDEALFDASLEESWLERAGHILRIAENQLFSQELPAAQFSEARSRLSSSKAPEDRFLLAFSSFGGNPKRTWKEIQALSRQTPNALPSWFGQWSALQESGRKKAILSAWTGCNLGDDLFIRLLCERYPDVDFYYFQTYPGTTDSLKTIPNFKIFDPTQNLSRSPLVTIGGSLFVLVGDYPQNAVASILGLDITEAQKRPWYVLGVNFGPYKSEKYISLFHKAFGLLKDICFRDKESYGLFSDLSNVRWAPDILFQYHLPKVERQKKIIISCIGDKSRESLVPFDMERYTGAMVRLASSYIDMGYQVGFACFCRNQLDQNVAYNIICGLSPHKARKTFIFEYNGDAETFLREFLGAEYIIATRFHAMILVWKAGIPVFPISYGDKTVNAIRSYGYQGRYCLFNEFANLSFQDVDENRTSGYHFNCEALVRESAKQFQALDLAFGRSPAQNG